MQWKRLQIGLRVLKGVLGRQTLARDLGVRTGLMVSLLLTIGVALVYYVESNRLQTHLDSRADESIELYANLIEKQVIPANREMLRYSNQLILNLEYIEGVETIWSNGERQSIGHKDERLRAFNLIRERTIKTQAGPLVVRMYFSRAIVQNQLLYILLMGVLLIVLAFLVVFPTAHILFFLFLRRPLKYLLKGIREIASGNYKYRIALTPQEDVNDIIENVNEMAEQIRIHEIELQISDAKYRHLVENSNDIIFSMNDDAQIITINHAVKKYLGFDVHELRGKPFEDLVYHRPDRADDYRLYVLHQKFTEIRESGRSQSFKLELCTSQGEPREMNMRLEYVRVGSAMVFFGKAENVPENIMGRFCLAERRSFRISNYFNLADLVINAITVNLSSFFPEDLAMEIKIGVKEMVLNSIEHGNLNISYAEKSRATSHENFLNLITSRQQDPEYADRQVEITYSLNRHRVLYRIQDEGDGFNHVDMRTNFEANIKQFHGRGIAITGSIFDVLQYNEVGNEVLLIKYTNSGEAIRAKT